MWYKLASIVTNYLPIEIKSKPYYVHAKQLYLEFRLLSAARAGQDVYENEYNKLNNSPSRLIRFVYLEPKLCLDLPLDSTSR